MDPITNPYSPGAGSLPPELAGRDQVRETVRIALGRIRLGRPAKSVLLTGLRGVGKTVLLETMRVDAERTGVQTIRIEAPEERSLPALLAPALRQALHRLSRLEAARDLSRRALGALAGFAKSLKVKYSDIEVGFDVEPEIGLADNGDLEVDLSSLLESVGRAAAAGGTALVIFLDEMQYLKAPQFAALITAMHRCSQDRLPVALVGAGLPQLPALAGNAKSYAERLFDFPIVGPLKDHDATLAIVNPARDQGIAFEDEAVQHILGRTQGYPYFLQEWGKQAWDYAASSPITGKDVAAASVAAIAALDESFFRVRFDRLTPREKQYLRSMANLGSGPHRSGDIAKELKMAASRCGPLRQGLIVKGMVWSPNFGETAFTVPLFDEFMKRIMPGEAWRTEV